MLSRTALVRRRLNTIITPIARSTLRNFRPLAAMSTDAAATKTGYLIVGYPECGFFRKAQKVALAYETLHPSEIAVTIVPFEYDAFHAQRIAILAKLGLPADHHRTCPIVSTYNPANVAEGATPEPEVFVGGCDNTMAALIERFGAIPETKDPAWKV